MSRVEGGLKLIVTGGGTGGHVSPGLAVAKVWQSRHGKDSVRWVGRRGGIEEKMCAKAGLAFLGVESMPLKRSLDPANLWMPLAMLRGLSSAWKIVRDAPADVVLMTGGFAALPMALATALNNRPLVQLELDAVSGLANRLVAGAAAAICLAQPIRHRRSNAVYTGSPVRFSARLPSKAAALEAFGLDAKKPVLLVLPGSGAARSINTALIEALPQLKGLQMIWMCGANDEKAVRAAVKKNGASASVQTFIDDVPMAYAAADLVLGRCGASLLAEIALTGRPSLLVPYPYATGDHQRKNAAAFVEKGASRMLLDVDLSGERLAAELNALLKDKEALKRMAAAARAIGRPDAAENVCGVCERVAKGFSYV